MSLAPHRTPNTSSSTLSSSKGCSHPEIPGADPREGGLSQVMSPNRIVDNQIINEQEDITCTEDNQMTDIEGRVKTLSYNQLLLSSTQGSIESIATPQEADFDDEQIRALLASPRYLPEREASAERSQDYHSKREGLMSNRRICCIVFTSE